MTPPPSTVVYRFHGNVTTDYLYSTNATALAGFTFDGPAFKVLPVATGATTPLYLCAGATTHFLSTALERSGGTWSRCTAMPRAEGARHAVRRGVNSSHFGANVCPQVVRHAAAAWK